MNNSPTVHVQAKCVAALARLPTPFLKNLTALLLTSFCFVGLVHAADVSTVTPADLASQIATNHPPIILDVRSPEEFSSGHVPGAINVAHTALESNMDQLSTHRDQDIVVYCVSGKRAGIALQWLKSHGFSRLWHLEGDYSGWVKEGHEVEVIEATSPH